MKRFATIIVTILLLTALWAGLYALAYGEVCDPQQPSPKYNDTSKIGWVKVKKSNPAYPNCVIKDFWYGSTRVPFVDEGKDGTCDKAYIWRGTGTKDAQGRDLFVIVDIISCESAEAMIQRWLDHYRKSKGI